MKDALSVWFAKRNPAEDSWSIRQWMNPYDLSRFCGESQRLRRDPEQMRGLVQVERYDVAPATSPKTRDWQQEALPLVVHLIHRLVHRRNGLAGVAWWRLCVPIHRWEGGEV